MIASGGVAATSSGIGSCQSANALSSADFSAGGSSPPLSRLRTLAHQYTWLPESLATPKRARAAASPGQDDEVADELEQAARRARRRSGFAAAARALERAAELSSDDDPRGRRLVAAADEAWLAGAPDQALALLDRAGGLVSDVRVRADLMHLRGTIGLRCGVPAEAATILAAGAAEVAPVVPAKAIEMLVEAAEAASYAGDAAQIVEFGRRASALLEDDAPDERLHGRRHRRYRQPACGGDAAGGAPLLREALGLVAGFQILAAWCTLARALATTSRRGVEPSPPRQCAAVARAAAHVLAAMRAVTT